MVSMDLGTAVKSYQFGERAKSELIITLPVMPRTNRFY